MEVGSAAEFDEAAMEEAAKREVERLKEEMQQGLLSTGGAGATVFAPRGLNPMAELATTYSELREGEKTLACLLQGMLGVRTTIELRSDAEVTGTIRSVDAHMNTSLTEVVLKPATPGARQVKCAAFYVCGKFIRYVHIPAQIHVEQTIQKRMTDTRAASRGKARPERPKRSV